MDAIEAIRTRGMRPRVTDEVPTREEIAGLLDLGVRAPNHHQTEPWRFYVLVGAERDRLARAMAEVSVESGIDEEAATRDGLQKVARAPVIVVFTCVVSTDERVVEAEEFASVAMAIENFLIGAHAGGIGAMLRTGPVAYHTAVRTHLGLGEHEHVVGFVYLGYPAADRGLTPRKPAAELTFWLGWD